jgi:hypothetical protein
MPKYETVVNKLKNLYKIHGLKQPAIRKSRPSDRGDYVSVGEIRISTRSRAHPDEHAKRLFCAHFMKVLNGFQDYNMKNLVSQMVEEFLN